MAKFLADLAAKVKGKNALRVGFMEGSNYVDGLPVAYVAAINEFGGTVNMPAHDVQINRSINEDTGEFRKGGKFVKKKDANYQTTHHVDAYTVTQYPRPFFRNMINTGKDHWGKDLAGIIKSQNYDAQRALDLFGMQLTGELRSSIVANIYRPLAASTIRRKGHAGQLVDTGNMLRSVTATVDI